MFEGTHSYLPDPRNEQILIYINGKLVPRAEAKISVFDSGFCLGDGVWEGLRIRNGRAAFLTAHLDRLYNGARAIDLDIGHSRDELRAAIDLTIQANQMISGVHIRLMVTRGIKNTPSQDPRVNIGPPTVVIIAEHKTPNPVNYQNGIRLITSHVRRGRPDVQDPKISSHSKLNCISAMVQVLRVGGDEALMLDPHGFVSTCNSTNFFLVRGDEVWTSTGDYCLNGITRSQVIDLCRTAGIPVRQRNFSLFDAYGADEAFVTGTFGGLTPVAQIDGRGFGRGVPGPLTNRLGALYEARVEAECR